MNIAFVIQKLAARSGGAERVLIETANEMANRGHDVEILSHENRGVKPFYPIHPNVKHRNLFNRPIEHAAKEMWKKREAFREKLPTFFPINHLKWQMTHGGFVRALRRYIEDNEPDVLVPFLPPAITPSILAARGTGVKVVASTHNEPSQDYENPKRWDSNPLDIKLRKNALSLVDKILVLLPEYRAWYPEQLHAKISDMPNPVRQVDSTILNNAVREKVVLGVGRLASVKRFEILIDAWLDLRRDFPDWKVEIYGDGPDKEPLAAMIQNYGLEHCVFLKGSTNEISAQYLRASVLCHPAEYEGFPLAVCEALAHGLPVVGFADCSGLNSLTTDDVNGVLVPPSRNLVITMKDSLAAILSDEDKRKRLSRDAPGTVAKYAPEIVYDRWEEAIRSVVGDVGQEI